MPGGGSCRASGAVIGNQERSERGPELDAVTPPPVAKVFVITGPSGVGKATLIRGLMEQVPELELSVSATTRKPRPGERDGADYHFLTPDEFERRAADGDFLEHATYSGHRYGTLGSEVERRVGQGRPVVLEIEVQGARQVRETMPESVLVFIAPPSRDALRARLIGRGTDTREQVDARMRTAEQELQAQSEFAHVIVNDRLEQATDDLVAIVRAALPDP
jgi:guanylate kinase